MERWLQSRPFRWRRSQGAARRYRNHLAPALPRNPESLRLSRDPRDLINAATVGCALDLTPAKCRDYAMRFSWRNAARQFLDNLVPMGW